MKKLMENKKAVISIAAAAVLIIAAIVIIFATGTNKNGDDTVKTEKPVMMCFISGTDDKAAETNTALDELQQEYSEKVKFVIINVDEDPDAITRYSLNALNPTGKPTTTYILLDTQGDFKDIKAGYTDKEALKESLKKVTE